MPLFLPARPHARACRKLSPALSPLRIAFLLASLLALAFALAQASPAAAAASTPWVTATNGRFVDTRTGNAVLLRGLDVTVGSSNLYQRAAAMGANFVRLTAAWEQIEPTAPVGGVHTYDPAFLSYLDTQVAYYRSQNVNVLIDLHQSGWSSYFASLTDGAARGVPPWLYEGKYTIDAPSMGQAKADFVADPQIAAWYRDLLTMIVNRYSAYPNVVGYEIFNEPQAGALDDLEATQTIVDWQAGMARLVATLDPQRTIFFMTRGGGDFGLESADLSGFAGLPHVALDLHDYFTGVGGLTADGEDWSPSWDVTHNQVTTNYQGTLQAQEELLVRNLDGARDHGWPLLVGEWGARVDDVNLATYQTQMLSLFARYRVSWTRWLLTKTGIFAILNADGSLTPAGLQLQQALGTTPTGLLNDGLPQVAGTVAFGSTLSASQGLWTGTVATYRYQWLRCDQGGGGCAAIQGATAPSYTVASADAESRLRVRVDVTGLSGSSTAMSAATVAAPPVAPLNTVLPQVTGQAQLGQLLTAGPGTWLGRISGYDYQWLNCDALGGNCTPIAGATTTTYTSKLADLGDRLAVRVTATGPGGVTTVDSVPSAPIAPIAIANVTPATLSGTPQADSQLLADKGTWTGTISTYAYQWLSCDAAGANCAAIAGATTGKYTLADGDVGDTVRVQATASGPGGSVTSTSAATAVVVDLAPSNDVPPVLNGTPVLGHGYSLSVGLGSWNGSNLVFTYRWKRCDAKGGSCVLISGATSKSYKLTTADLGYTLRAYARATNPAGSLELPTPVTPVIVYG